MMTAWLEYLALSWLLGMILIAFGIGTIDCSTLVLILLAGIEAALRGLLNIDLIGIIGHGRLIYGLIAFAVVWQLSRQRFV